MLHRVLELVPGERLTAAARYDVSEAVFLRQHTPNVSAVSSLDRRVRPAGDAADLQHGGAGRGGGAPGARPRGHRFERLDAARWMTFERDAVEAGISAQVVARGERLEVAAAIFDPADPRRVYLSGRVVLERDYPPAPAAPEFSDPGR